jgi:putative ATP-binding cassette transporter
MQIDHPEVLKERLASHVEARARTLARPRPGPDALRMLRLLGGIVSTPARWRAIGLLAAVVLATLGHALLALRLNTWNADFFDIIERKSMPGLLTQAGIFGAIVLGLMVVQAAGIHLRRSLQITLRLYLTRTIRDAWMTDGRHYRLRSLPGEHDNEDGRIAEDGRIVCEMVVDFLASLLYATAQLVLFVGVLWFTSGPLTLALGRFSVTVPGHMVFVALIYAAAGATLTTLVGHPLVRATDRRQQAEAGHRARLLHAISNAPTIALTGAEAAERARMEAAFTRVRVTWAEQTASFRKLVFLASGYTQLTVVLPLLILAPRHFAGEMSLGTLMQVALAFGQVTAALSWMSDNYPALAEWEASAERVLRLHDAVVDLVDGAVDGEPGRLRRLAANGPGLAFRDLSLVSAAGEVLVAHLDAEIRPGERVLIETTPQAAAALFRAVAGLSPWGAGRIELPDDAMPFFMADRPYLAEAPLAELLAAPRAVASFQPGDVAQAMVDAGLAHLVPRLATVAPWEQELGVEDQQRLGFARTLLHKPAWLLMHESTSGLDAVTEERLMDLLVDRLAGAAIVTIAHRPLTGYRFHRRIALSVEPPRGTRATAAGPAPGPG